VNLADPAHPLFAGTIDMVGGVLALTDSGLLLSTARSPFGGDSELGGVRTAALRSIVYINSVVPDPIEVTRDDLVRRNVLVTFRALVDPKTIQSAVVDLEAPNRTPLRLSATMNGDNGEVTLAEGTDLGSVRSLRAKAIINPGTDETKASTPREIEVFKPRIAEISFEYDHAPTFRDAGRTEPVFDGAGNVIRDPDDGPFSPNERANKLDPLAASFRLILKDQRGTAFAEEDVLILAENDELELDVPGPKTTDELGRVGSRITVNLQKVTENGKTRLTILSGQTLRDYNERKISPAQLKALSDEALTSKHHNTGHSLRYERTIEEQKAEVISLEMPRLRQTDFIAALNSLASCRATTCRRSVASSKSPALRKRECRTEIHRRTRSSRKGGLFRASPPPRSSITRDAPTSSFMTSPSIRSADLPASRTPRPSATPL